MSKQTPHGDGDRKASPASAVLMTLVVLLSLAACGLMLLVPTRSISVTTVYKGF